MTNRIQPELRELGLPLDMHVPRLESIDRVQDLIEEHLESLLGAWDEFFAD